MEEASNIELELIKALQKAIWNCCTKSESNLRGFDILHEMTIADYDRHIQPRMPEAFKSVSAITHTEMLDYGDASVVWYPNGICIAIVPEYHQGRCEYCDFDLFIAEPFEKVVTDYNFRRA
jgi:hypothetical protein